MANVNPEKLAIQEYKKELKRVKALIAKYQNKGFTFPKSILPKESKTITQNNVEELKKITPGFIESKATLIPENKESKTPKQSFNQKSKGTIGTAKLTNTSPINKDYGAKENPHEADYYSWRNELKKLVETSVNDGYIWRSNYNMPKVPEKITPKSVEKIEKEYNKVSRYISEYKRLLEYIEKGEDDGYFFKDNAIPVLRTVITEKSIERLENLTEKDLYKGSKWFNPETGKFQGGLVHKYGRTPRKKKEKEKEETFGPPKPPETPNMSELYDVFDQITKRITEMYYLEKGILKYGGRIIHYDTQEDKETLLNIWRNTVDEYTDTPEKAELLFEYVINIEATLAELLSAIQQDYERVNYSKHYTEIAMLLSASSLKGQQRTMEEAIRQGEELASYEIGEPEYAG